MGSSCTKDQAAQDLLNSKHFQFQMLQSMHSQQPYDGYYDLVKEIGIGSTCHVNQVMAKGVKDNTTFPTNTKDTSEETKQCYAVKEITMSEVHEGRLQAFKNEIQLLKSIDHPRIVKIFQTFRFHGTSKFSAIVMELCSGGDLESRQKSYTEQEVSKIIQQVLSAASYLHERNIVHRDFKLENILFVDPEQLDVKIIDFGVAKKYATKKERHYERYGTLYTMSPEAIKGSYTGSSTDLWSIGVIAYILLCKKKPFHGKNASEIRRQILNKEITFDNDCCISHDAKTFVRALLRRIPEQRLTAKEALQHDFIQKYHQLSCVERKSSVLLSKIHESIQRFLHSTDLRQIILQRIASRYPANEILDLTHLFTNLDTTGEGALYFSDFITILADFSYSDAELKDIFGCIELNNTGRILYTEFLACTLEAKGPIQEYRIREVFEQIDTSSKGSITQQDLRRILPKTVTEQEVRNLFGPTTLMEAEQPTLSWEQFLSAVNFVDGGMQSTTPFCHGSKRRIILPTKIHERHIH